MKTDIKKKSNGVATAVLLILTEKIDNCFFRITEALNPSAKPKNTRLLYIYGYACFFLLLDFTQSTPTQYKISRIYSLPTLGSTHMTSSFHTNDFVYIMRSLPSIQPIVIALFCSDSDCGLWLVCIHMSRKSLASKYQSWLKWRFSMRVCYWRSPRHNVLFPVWMDGWLYGLWTYICGSVYYIILKESTSWLASRSLFLVHQ